MAAKWQKQRLVIAGMAMSRKYTGVQRIGVDVKHATLAYEHCLALAKHL